MVYSENKSCTCDDIGDGPCSVHFRENQLQDEVIRLRNELHELKEDQEKTRSSLDNSHAAIKWFATVRDCVSHGSLCQERSPVYILTVAHAVSEVWLSGERISAENVADLLGWSRDAFSKRRILDILHPLIHKIHPPLVVVSDTETGDFRPNIQKL